MAISVYLIGRHALVRAGIEMLLSREMDITVRGGAGTGREALAQIRRIGPDVVLCDLILPDTTAMDLIARIERKEGHPRVVILAELEEGPWHRRVVRAGAGGYISLGSEVRELLHAVREAAKGGCYLSNSIAQKLALAPRSAIDDPFDALSPREMAVAGLLVRGLRQKEIARRLGIQPKTVGTYKARLQAKLGIQHTLTLLRMAEQYGRIWPEDAGWSGGKGRSSG